jgi:hypothetical protein
MVYNSIKTRIALIMPCVSFEMCLTLATINFLIEMHLAYNNILDVFSKTHTKVHYAFQTMEILFPYNLM